MTTASENRLADFDYALPPELIAQQPLAERDRSRLMVVDRAARRIEHRSFRDLPDYLRRGDVLVLNDTRVMAARLLGRREATGGGGAAVQALVLSARTDGTCRLLVTRSGRLKSGEVLSFEEGAIRLRLVLREREGSWQAASESGPLAPALERVGRAPLPPYIRRRAEGQAQRQTDRQRYQTVFARRPGAVAAPTAGLHFTPDLLAEAVRRGAAVAYLTLHVGLGTFEPIRTDRIEDHRMHAEWYDFPAETAERCEAGRRARGRILAVGTTSARTLESVWVRHGGLHADRGLTDLYIYPPFTFRAVDALLTNFHLPRSSLLLLVCAFAGRDLVLSAYEEAVRERYRFYSYGDAMLIL